VSETDELLADSVSQLATVVLGEQTLEELLSTVVRLARSAIPGVDGVSISLADRGALTTSHASDDVVRELDGVQYRDGTGPCIDAFRRGEPVCLAVLHDGARYPHFAAAAEQRFMTGVLSTPLAVRGDAVGALNCYSASVDRFDDAAVEVVTAFARHASVLLANATRLAAATTTNDQLEQALLSRDLIGQAKGILMERSGCSADQAFGELRRASQHENKKLTAVALEVVEGRRHR
jgi:GAF domain-containing protein